VGNATSTPGSRWVSPPTAARELGISSKTIRNLIMIGTIVPRLRNVVPNPKQRKYLVNIDEVAAATRLAANDVVEPASLAERAARIRAKGGGS